ncbi:Adenylate cyclase [Sandaracinus amylolyticus]|uniref:Adenylate cyclase n=2 Tax=Sandaracinus amylolyticus TaxID=927083 RepID=A0A0F6W8H2_9BACT|nr:Adenylate cyclase [Sandaracinus amylolyticus]
MDAMAGTTNLDAGARIAELEARVALLEERWRLNDAVDRLAEIAVRDRLPLDHAMRLLMPVLCDAVDARVAWIRTYDETLSLHDYVHATGDEATLPIDLDALAARADAGAVLERVGSSTVVAQRIDVAGDPFGTAAVLIPTALDDRQAERVRGLLHVFCEEIDNTLASIALARKKALAIDAMSDALAEPVLDDGLRAALAILQANVPFEDMLLVFRHEDDASGRTLHYKIIQNGVLVHDSTTRADPEIDAFLRSRAFRMMAGDDAEVRERFGIRRYREEVLINGVRSARVVGRLVVSSKRGEFNTFDRDLLDRFADSLRQRIVDFNREWKTLSVAFPRDACDRLLREESYREKYLTPRERECAVMFCDISGFTRVCEQVLVRPQAIGRLVDTWSERVVEILWETGGVFDKMVGDCIIGIWGPPFFDRSSKELCLAAMDAAARIRDFTRSLTTHEDLPELAGAEPLDVATGLHWCPLFVGVFGPDEDYTGFSAGMNNTARLQGQAKGGEILCMDSLVGVVDDDARFEAWREAKVKNVEHPLRFRAMRR